MDKGALLIAGAASMPHATAGAIGGDLVAMLWKRAER